MDTVAAQGAQVEITVLADMEDFTKNHRRRNRP